MGYLCFIAMDPSHFFQDRKGSAEKIYIENVVLGQSESYQNAETGHGFHNDLESNQGNFGGR
jgi:hypothetical protein